METKNLKPLTKPNTPHYQTGGIEPIDYIVANGYDFLEGNVIKYLDRYKHKGMPISDLKKLRQYADWLIEREEANRTNVSLWPHSSNIKPGGTI